ncbi:MAG TPA: response regulator [Candidatus Paceibacterota bacterium]|nr:response regulator [Candidatus Paceibacterota bacterium]
MSTTAEPIANPHTILVVDDHEGVRVTLAFLLDRTYRVIAAESGPRAIALAGEENFEGALIDLHMPVMDGFETCQRLQAQAAAAGRTLRVWFMSAAFTAEARRRTEELGAVGVFTKPFDHDQLLDGLKLAFLSPPTSVSSVECIAIPAESNAPQ